jgi:tRNA (Thr-GGU) A37 N-methylase
VERSSEFKLRAIGVVRVDASDEEVRGLLRKGFREEDLPLLGVFATDSPVRPNPIALTLVRLLGREGNRIRVKGLDLFDGTPVLDIKPYRPDYRASEFRVPDWVLHDSRGDI